MPVPTKEWFSNQVTDCQTALFRTARAILRSDADAEDAVQETILAAYTGLETLRDPGKFKPWILRILTNKCYGMYRSCRNTVDLEDVENILSTDHGDTAQKLSLWQAVGRLPQDQRVTITLFYYEDLNIRQISRVLEQSPAVVKTRLYRGRQHLKELLGEEGDL